MKPTIIKKKAIDVTPHFHGIWCSIQDDKPFINEIALRRWSNDGEVITFLLETHNGLSYKPDDEIDVVELQPSNINAEWFKKAMERDAKEMSCRPERIIERAELEKKVSKLEKEKKELQEKIDALIIFGP